MSTEAQGNDADSILSVFQIGPHLTVLAAVT